MKRLLLILVLWCLPILSVPAEPAKDPLWFPVGEVLTFRLYWGFIPVGHAEFSSSWMMEGGKRFLRLQAWARSNRVLRKIYPVDDYIESVLDPETFLPVRYQQRLNEGRRLRHDYIAFDHAGGKAVCTSAVKNKEETISIDTDWSLKDFRRDPVLSDQNSEPWMDGSGVEATLDAETADSAAVAGVEAGYVAMRFRVNSYTNTAEFDVYLTQASRRYNATGLPG